MSRSDFYEDTVYFCGAWDVAQPLQQGQGLGSVSKDQIQKAIGKQWSKRCE